MSSRLDMRNFRSSIDDPFVNFTAYVPRLVVKTILVRHSAVDHGNPEAECRTAQGL